jgi:hypothetical protein
MSARSHQHDVHDEGICDANVLAFLKPLRLQFLRRLIGENHERVPDSFARCGSRGKHDVDVSGSAMVLMYLVVNALYLYLSG